MNGCKRREFLRGLGGGVLAAGGLWRTLGALAPATAAEARVSPEVVRFRPEMEEVVAWIETTPRDRILETAAAELKRGLSYRRLLGGLFLAGIRNIKPRPVGFKFHAVMVINSAHQLGLDAAPADRLLPLFWALDNFKASQEQDVKEGDWSLAPVKESAVPTAGKARKLFIEAMERWDEEAADAAIAGLCRGAGASEVIDHLWRYGARDWQNIGHKMIFTTQCWRTLQTIGWEHAEPVLRSLVFGLLNGGASDSAAPYAASQTLLEKVPAEWASGRVDPAASTALLAALRQAKPEDASRQVLEMLERGIASSSLWDGILLAAGELLMRQPGILALHAVTAANALHFGFEASSQDATRLLILLQAAAWIPLYREGIRGRGGLKDEPRIDRLEAIAAGELPGVKSTLEELSRDRLLAARRIFSHAAQESSTRAFMDGARHLTFIKGTDSHDYKFAAAAFEECHLAHPAWRPHFLAASAFQLRGAAEPDSALAGKAQQALSAL